MRLARKSPHSRPTRSAIRGSRARDIGLANVGEYDRLGLILGSSHIFGFALSHNGETLPCELGVARSQLQQKRFGTHRRHFAASSQARQRLAEACRFKLMNFPAADDLLFVDEYHYRAESQSLIAERLAQQIT
jgi:hypothetical protein